MTSARTLIAFGLAASVSAGQAAAQPTEATPTQRPTPVASDKDGATTVLDRQAEELDEPDDPEGGRPGVYAGVHARVRERTPIERASGIFVGANFAYAAMAKVEVGTETMSGTVDFPAVFAAELQAGYRVFPFLSVALVPQMLFNLRPNQEDPAHELEVFAQATGHLVIKPKWDFNVFVAPGYSVLILPGAENAHGLAFRWGAGPMFHFTKHISFAAELSHQVGFQGTERAGGNVDMKTSFFSLFAGIRLRP